jgi:DNA processing protein
MTDDRIRKRVIELLGPTPVTLDEIIRQSGASAGDVLCAIMGLELAGRVHRELGGLISLA